MKKLVAIFALLTLSASAVDVIEVKVKALDGFGGDVGGVISRCQTRAGAPYDPVTVTRDVTTLTDSKEYEEVASDVRETAGGVEVVFLVKRKPRFQAPLIVEGAEFFSESKILSESELKDGYLYGESDLAEAARKVREAYRKKHFPDVKVTPVVTPIPGANNSCTFKFVIIEGVRAKLKGFVFLGCNSIEESELHKAVGDYPWWNPVGWVMDRPVTLDAQVQGAVNVAKVYRNAGFLDVKVSPPERIYDDEGNMRVRYIITEGVRYTIGKQTITGLTRYPEGAVRGKSELPESGSIAGESTIEEAAHRIEVVVGSGDLGLAESHVAVKELPSESDPTVIDLVYEVTEGLPVVINEVKIRGNDYTQDKVIRRSISLGPGDPMRYDLAERSKRRLEGLHYFSRVAYKLEPTGKGKDANGCEYRDLVYEVEEQNTGSFMVGVGASTVDSVFVTVEASQSNFDLFAPLKFFRGGGQKARIYVAAGPRYQSYEVSLQEPHFLSRYLELTGEAHRRYRWYDQYDIIRSGGGVTLSYPVKFWKDWEAFGRLGFGLSGEYIEFDDVEYGNWTYNGREVSLRKEEQDYGDAFEGVFRVFWAHDSRDNDRIPTSGSRTQLFLDLAGGDNEYWKAGFSHRSYFNVWRKYNHVLMANVRFETIDALSGEVPIYNRLFLGGPRSVRGLEYRHVSPFAKRSYGYAGDSIPWGGQTLGCINLEYTIPLFKMVRFAVFTDLGAVAEGEFDFDVSDCYAWSVGAGLRLDIPMFPIRLDVAKPIEKPDEAEEEIFSFTIGYDF